MTSSRRLSDSEDLQPYSFDDENGFGGEDRHLEGGAIEDEDYDAANSETFGLCEPIGNDGGLAALAEKAKLLNFDDSDVNPNSWPDPTSIPVPGNLNHPFLADERGIWGFHDGEPSTSRKTDTSEDFFSFISNTELPQSFRNAGSEVPKVSTNSLNNDRQRDLKFPPFHGQALTEEDILNQAAAQDKPNLIAQLFNAHHGSGTQDHNQEIPNVNVLALMNNSRLAEQRQSVNTHMNAPPNAVPHPNSSLPGFGGPPQLHHGAHGQFPSAFQGVNVGGGQQSPMVPPPFNGMPPMMHPAMMGKVLPPMMMPGGPIPPQMFWNGPMPPPMMSPRPPPMYNRQGPNNGRQYRERKPCLPSTKTISDFAFDPYAGLMSKKEREWLIKIQLIQCMGTGDPWDDDYYYTIWKERNVLAKAPPEWKIKIKPKYYSFEDTYPSDRYIPPVFNGSLGRPTHVSTNFPRQIIDLHNDADDESQLGRVNTQKKLRAILMKIENAFLSLLEVKDVLYKKEKETGKDSPDNSLKDTANERIAAIVQSIATVENLPTVMLVQKGRQLVAQLILQADEQLRVFIFDNLINTVHLYTRKIPNDTNSQPLMRAIVSSLHAMDICIFKAFRDTFPIGKIEPFLSISTFAQQLCLSFLVGFCGRELSPEEIVSGPVGEWLSGVSAERGRVLQNVLNQEALDVDLLNLYRGLSVFLPSSVAHGAAELLRVRIKQRP